MQKPSLRYIDEFIRLRCATDLLHWRLYPNAKEITESMAAYEAVRRYFWKRGYNPRDSTIRLIAVGDGSTPRTAALFAVRTNWECYSIDPALNDKDWSAIRRLHICRSRIEDHTFQGPTIVVAVHSHASLEAVQRVCGKCPIVAIPCCVPQTIEVEPDIQYEDMGILSPERSVRVWYARG